MLLWSERKTPKARVKPSLSQASHPSAPQSEENGHIAFLQYLRRLLPVVIDPLHQSKKSSDRGLRKVARDPDYFMPFRDVAPTRSYAIKNLCSDKDRLLTQEGFGSLLLHRAFFYGSDFGKSHPGFFTDISEWDDLHAALVAAGKDNAYFIRNGVYGSASKHRQVDFISKLWVSRTEWPAWHANRPEFTFLELLQFLKGENRFYGVGPLTALLIAGDMAVADACPMPSAEDVGNIIFDVKKGALKGLQKYGLVGSSPTRQEVVDAFVALHIYLVTHLTAEEKHAMGYTVLMLEHSLCKNTRLKM
ncbi:hypothetical protein FPV67DRAFT_1416126 [Lyophyllum atratum]|nr:hypothetical protein FPV67DRAFT_1416126 [Lyophyllum atratum]